MMKVCVRVFECVECNHNLYGYQGYKLCIFLYIFVFEYFITYSFNNIFSDCYKHKKKNSSPCFCTHTQSVYLLYVDLKTLFESYFSSTKHKECSFPNATCTTFFNPSTFTGVTRYAALLSN